MRIDHGFSMSLAQPMFQSGKENDLMACVMFILREVFPAFQKWRYYNTNRREVIGKCQLQIMIQWFLCSSSWRSFVCVKLLLFYFQIEYMYMCLLIYGYYMQLLCEVIPIHQFIIFKCVCRKLLFELVYRTCFKQLRSRSVPFFIVKTHISTDYISNNNLGFFSNL